MNFQICIFRLEQVTDAFLQTSVHAAVLLLGRGADAIGRGGSYLVNLEVRHAYQKLSIVGLRQSSIMLPPRHRELKNHTQRSLPSNTLRTYLNMSATASGITPGLWLFPIIVCVLPLLVCP
eukprot:COSAG01_NODE_456_length_16789_cov_58.288556_14_plen_121_part_00